MQHYTALYSTIQHYMHSTMHPYTALYSTIQHYTALHSTTALYAAPCITTQHYAALYINYKALYAQHYASLYSTIHHDTALYSTIKHYTALQQYGSVCLHYCCRARRVTMFRGVSQGSKSELVPLDLRNSIGMASSPKKIPTLGYMLRTVRNVPERESLLLSEICNLSPKSYYKWVAWLLCCLVTDTSPVDSKADTPLQAGVRVKHRHRPMVVIGCAGYRCPTWKRNHSSATC